MTMMMKQNKRNGARLLLAAMLALGTGLASADHGQGGNGRWVFDSRYHHDHYYPAPGFVAPWLPRGSIAIGFGVDSYWFNGGVWYRPYGTGYRVVLPPVGVIVPALPGAYVTLRIGGLPYYYANGVYYSAAPGGYAVVPAPPGGPTASAVPSPPPAPPRPEPIFYPRQGQSAAQTEIDHRECNSWATTQPGAVNDASVFGRAVEACMDGHGYSMR